MLAQALVDIPAQLMLVTEEMHAAGDVEHKPVGTVKRDQRRIAVAPVGEFFQKGGVLARRREGDVEIFELRPGVGQSHGLEQAGLGGAFVKGCQAQGIGNLVNDNQKLAGLSPLRIFAFEAVGGQVWKPQRQKPVRSV